MFLSSSLRRFPSIFNVVQISLHIPMFTTTATPTQMKHFLRCVSTNLSDLEYHQKSEQILVQLQEAMEDLCDTLGIKDVDIQYASGVLTFHLSNHGTYVINKQPANQQIWLSSPISGPKKFEFQDSHWNDVRDTKINLVELLNQELHTFYPTPQIQFKSFIQDVKKS